ncbi:MAG: helix-turn-helix transcriptional regulator [Erysipelotrichaceae bacterium]|nr:helix-turn-helix transcriptional regulator [Erysipelotrichaceae bacterium]
MLKRALELWKREKDQKGTTLHRRLIVFFILISVSLILCFTLLLMIFGITGKAEKEVNNHLDTELANISQTIHDDFGRISLGGIAIAEELAHQSDIFFEDHDITAAELQEHRELIVPLLEKHIHTLLNTINNRICGGTFVILDASVNTWDLENSKAGIFLKKTQPTATDTIGVDVHYLRGPAQIARDHEIMLLGQWKMEYDIEGQEFFQKVIDTANENPDLSLSRLYYWSERETLKGNSEAGFLLCLPLRSKDGTVFGICGVEVSDRLFKLLYSPKGGTYKNIFTLMSTSQEDVVYSSKGLIAGNHYLTGNRWSIDLAYEREDVFEYYTSKEEEYGGKSTSVKLYPNGSPYEDEEWTVAVLIPKDLLEEACKGNVSYFIMTIMILLVASIVASIFVSKRYLHPVTQALQSIRDTSGERKNVPYMEINDLFDFLEEKDREHEEELRQREQHHEYMKNEYEKAQLELSRLAYSRKSEIDPDLYQQFLDHLFTLTPTEREVFNLYVSGKHAKEIMEILCIKENTLKYHNRNIYGKLGVTSRKELLRYAALMQQDSKGGKYR